MLPIGKADSLIKLNEYQKKYGFIIPRFFFFYNNDYKKNKSIILNKIRKDFKKIPIIIRSSSVEEDTEFYSNAGKYSSFVVKSNNFSDVEYYINKSLKKLKNKNDKIIIQKYIDKPSMSGVIFTRGINDNSPYYYINFDKSGRTDLITSGKKNKSLYQIVTSRNYIKKSKFSKLLSVVNKIEKIAQNDRLDLEFCIRKNKIYLLQCRHLKKTSNIVNDNKIYTALNNTYKKILNLQKEAQNLAGRTTLYSNMSDWNPAEMIGVKPTNLSLSLYKELITNQIWSEQRINYGYESVKPNPLLISFLNSPYIDLRVDFNSFLPKNLKKKTKEKIINHSINLLKSKPHLHDKIEFEVMETCYDLYSKEKISKYLNKKETQEYLNSLIKITNNIINSSKLSEELSKVSRLEKEIASIKNKKINYVGKIFFLINNCKLLGTLPFAGVARCAFISTKLLKSFLEKKIISHKEYLNIYSSNKSVQRDINNILLKKGTKKFLDKFGHLRPFTYQITSKNYKEAHKNYFNHKELKFIKKERFNISNRSIKLINKELRKKKFNFTAKKFINFVKESIYQRERVKLIFTKSIDEIFLNLINLGKEIGINRNHLQHLTINSIIDAYNNLEAFRLKKKIKIQLKENIEQFSINRLVEFPDIIKRPEEIYEFVKSSNKANYITKKNYTGEIMEINKINKNYSSLKNKIILLENADPGFDFIFSNKIKGLITKYGGANSHMSIRCFELDIPAAIGVGDIIYKKIKNSKRINLDCNMQQIINIH